MQKRASSGFVWWQRGHSIREPPGWDRLAWLAVPSHDPALPSPGVQASAFLLSWSFRPELHVLVGTGERKAGDEPEARLFHARPVAAHGGELPDRGEHRLLVDE